MNLAGRTGKKKREKWKKTKNIALLNLLVSFQKRFPFTHMLKAKATHEASAGTVIRAGSWPAKSANIILNAFVLSHWEKALKSLTNCSILCAASSQLSILILFLNKNVPDCFYPCLLKEEAEGHGLEQLRRAGTLLKTCPLFFGFGIQWLCHSSSASIYTTTSAVLRERRTVIETTQNNHWHMTLVI